MRRLEKEKAMYVVVVSKRMLFISNSYDQAKFRHVEAYVKMTLYAVLMIYSLYSLISGVEDAYSAQSQRFRRLHRGRMF
jgi:hypothetical protein